MQTEQIVRIKLTASEGMLLTDGKEYARVVFLAVGEDPSRYYEIPESEYNKILEEQEKANQSIHFDGDNNDHEVM